MVLDRTRSWRFAWRWSTASLRFGIFELRGSLALSQVNQVLQAAFGWEDAYLHRFVTSDPFAPLRPVDGEIPEVPPAASRAGVCEEAGDRPEKDCSLDQLLALGSGQAHNAAFAPAFLDVPAVNRALAQ